ncbi:MAG: hypothetical protein VX617_06205, partial [Pseudomonadota bacterium]|nr:hypothetical protein [Pseudomonadota bacterium]
MRLDKTHTVDLFLKTWQGDAKWLPYCLAGLGMFANDFRQLVLITDKGFFPSVSIKNIKVQMIETDPEKSGYTENPPFKGVTPTGRIVDTAPRGPGYYWQQAIKLSWPKFSDADAVIMLDTDVIAWGEFNQMDFTLDGRPYWMKRPYENKDNDLIWK